MHKQYQDSSNLGARAAIYRFATGPGLGPAQVLDLMLATVPVDADVLEVGFAGIVVHQRRASLRITEPEAVVRYVLSFDEAKERIVGDRLEELRGRVQHEVQSSGAFVVQTHSGLFVARKA